MTDHTITTEAADLVHDIEEDERRSEAVVRAVSRLTQTPILDLDPLFDTIDPHYVDGLFSEGKETSISFRYAGCRVSVTQHTVRVCIDQD